MKHNSILHMVMLVGLLIGFTCAAESFRDDFSSTENLRAIDNITRVRDYPRIVTHPDVRINRLDANEYRDSKTNKTIGFGWFPSILRLANGDLLCFHREGREHPETDRPRIFVGADHQNEYRRYRPDDDEGMHIVL